MCTRVGIGVGPNDRLFPKWATLSRWALKYFLPLGTTPEVPSSVDVWTWPRCRLWQFGNSILQSRSQGFFPESSGYQRKARNGKRRKVKYYGHCSWKNWQVCQFIHPPTVSRYLGWCHYSLRSSSYRFTIFMELSLVTYRPLRFIWCLKD